MTACKKLAIVLFNLGGPDGPADVEPFLRNLFSDKAIIGLPAPLRLPLARLIARRRREEATANYAQMGGGSPLKPGTEAQARALEEALATRLPDHDSRVFLAMRYWAPFTEETARIVAGWGPAEIVLLPLYPQFSTTTTASSLQVWRSAYAGDATVRAVCCYPDQSGFIDAHVERILSAYDQAGRPENTRLLFSAHGIPERLVARGDPYQWQVERTVAAVVERLGGEWDWRLCYQSRVGPLKWLGPSTPEAIRQAAADGRNLLVSPIAFVSEHVETLVELDREYADLAHEVGIARYVRVPAIATAPSFITSLADMVAASLDPNCRTVRTAGARACPAEFGACPLRRAA